MILSHITYPISSAFKKEGASRRTRRFDLPFKKKMVLARKAKLISAAKRASLLLFKLRRFQNKWLGKNKDFGIPLLANTRVITGGLAPAKGPKRLGWAASEVSSETGPGIFLNNVRLSPVLSSTPKNKGKYPLLFGLRQPKSIKSPLTKKFNRLNVIFNKPFWRFWRTSLAQELIITSFRSRKHAPRLLNSFNKRWQRAQHKLLMRELGGKFKLFLHQIRHESRRTDKNFTLKTTKSTAMVNTLVNTTLISFLKNVFGFSWKVSLLFIKGGLILVNNEVMRNPFFNIQDLTLIRFNVTPLYALVLRFLFWRFTIQEFMPFLKKSFFRRFTAHGFIEANYTLGEYLVLPNFKENFNFFRSKSFFEMVAPLHLSLSQRFFKKQKRFGLGRLI